MLNCAHSLYLDEWMFDGHVGERRSLWWDVGSCLPHQTQRALQHWQEVICKQETEWFENAMLKKWSADPSPTSAGLWWWCWDPQMKLFIVDFKMDSELNSMSQNSPFFTHEFKIQLWASIGQGDRQSCSKYTYEVLYLSISIFCYIKLPLHYIYLITLVTSYFTDCMLAQSNWFSHQSDKISDCDDQLTHSTQFIHTCKCMDHLLLLILSYF